MEFIFVRLPQYLIALWLFYSMVICFNYKSAVKTGITNYYVFESIPQVFITLGLLGTFTGITQGLLNFDTSPDLIKESIKDLLIGLKAAFFTTIAGISLNLVFGKIVKYKINKGIAIEPEFQKEIHELMEINKSLKDLSKNITHSIDKAIVDSLKGVVEDVNNTFKSFIDQLVSENFNRLTESIDQLTKWQVQYREDIIIIAKAYKALVERHQQFVEKTQEWVETLDEIAGQSSQLAKIIDDFKAVTDDESKFSEIIREVKESTKNMQLASDALINHSNSLEEVNESFISTKDEITEWLNREEGIRDSVNALSHSLQELRSFDISSIEKLDEGFNDRLSNTFKGLDSLLKEYISYLENKNN